MYDRKMTCSARSIGRPKHAAGPVGRGGDCGTGPRRWTGAMPAPHGAGQYRYTTI